MPRKVRKLIRDKSNEPSRTLMKKIDQYHKWIEWSEENQTYLSKCPDLITGIHGDDPVKLYGELCQTLEEVIEHFEENGRPLPPPRVRPMQEVG